MTLRGAVALMATALLVAACGAATPSATPGAAPTTAPTTPSPAPRPSASPVWTEEWITYEWYAEGDDYRSVFVARPDGSDAHVIAADLPGEHRGPTWSSAGDRIAFVVIDEATPNGSLWTAAGDGSEVKLLFDPQEDCPDGAYWPAWSPDDRSVSLVCYSGGDTASIAVFDTQTQEVTKLFSTQWPGHLDNPASWSPDGATLVFDYQQWDPTNEFLDGSRIGVLAAAGGEVTWATDLDSFAAWPNWHPTDDLIAYNTYDLGNMHEVEHASNIWTMRPDGSQATKLTGLQDPASRRAAQARWLPDGSGLIASCAYGNPVNGVQICFVDPASGAISFSDHVIFGARPDLRPSVD